MKKRIISICIFICLLATTNITYSATPTNDMSNFVRIYEPGGNHILETIQTSDTGYVTVGWLGGDTRYFQKASIIKFEENGSVQWSKSFGGSGYSNVVFTSAVELNDGSFVATGYASVELLHPQKNIMMFLLQSLIKMELYYGKRRMERKQVMKVCGQQV